MCWSDDFQKSRGERLSIHCTYTEFSRNIYIPTPRLQTGQNMYVQDVFLSHGLYNQLEEISYFVPLYLEAGHGIIAEKVI